jgi:hypothetical protein
MISACLLSCTSVKPTGNVQRQMRSIIVTIGGTPCNSRIKSSYIGLRCAKVYLSFDRSTNSVYRRPYGSTSVNVALSRATLVP